MKISNKLMKILMTVALTSALLPAAAASAVQQDKPGVTASTDQIMVKVKPGKAGTDVAAKHGAKLKKNLTQAGYQVLKVPTGQSAEALLAELQADPAVETAELDAVYSVNFIPNDPSFVNQWHLTKIQAPQAWDYALGTGVTIAIIDTGVDIQHPDLSSKIVAGYDFVNNDTDADDDQGHGTHVAGIAAASGNNGLNGSGVAPNARIMPVKVLNYSGSGYTSDIISGLFFAADNGAKVINLSMGGGAYSSAFQNAVNYAWNKGAVIVAAAGNNGNTTVQYPAGYNNVFSVACTTSTDAKCSFSNYGTWVDIAAPGLNIYSTANGGGMTTMSGTSMATPIVSGVAALTIERFGYSVSPATVVDRICSSADKIINLGTNCGRVNAYRSVQ
ncbi:thermitase [Tumebacillus sp. BK434]|uniref:S8 family peptidase n=1 Tax=Tumebacillus sp. BK434 TaxID=2512169 RepID=UPI00104BEFF3|nr:S8 family peptidase [Tumebacillus sp. BK434]TCP59167.1 thermitase [Tumebacillus sp. BK434]